MTQLSLDIEALKNLLYELLAETVTSQVLKELENDVKLSGWVKTGIDIHKNEEGFKRECAFCKNELKESRAKEIEGHFNDAYNSFIAKIDKNIELLAKK